MKEILNLGCGDTKYNEAVNVDICEELNPDVVHDLNIFPWPCDDESFQKIIAKDIYEHVDDPIKFMKECWRILKRDGYINIRTSYFKSENSFTDPTHKRFLTLGSFDYFDITTEVGRKYWWYSDLKFKIVNKIIDGQELEFVLQKVTV